MRTKLLLTLLLLVGALWWESTAVYAQNDQTPAQIECTPLVTNQPAEEQTYTIETNTYFVEDQAILVGLKEDIDTVLAALPQLEVEPLRTITGDQFLGRQTIQLVETNAGNAEELVTEIYAAIIRLREEQVLQQVVYVDFNYWTDLAQHGAHGVHGSPHSVGAHPLGTAATVTFTAAFTQQWAFTAPNGVGLLTGITGTRIVTAEGTPATHVAIFDTSPYAVPGLKVIPDIDVPGQADKDGLVICVSHPDLPELDVDHEGEAPIDVRDHGLFVAGLVHAVAPGVSLDLIKTLNEQGHGHLFWLLEALTLYLDDAISSRGTLQGTVINLSLSVDSPPTTTMSTELVDQINDFISLVGYPSLPTGALPIFTLQQVLEAAYSGGATIVAAAGNEASPTTMQTPAAYTFVIGAAATAMNGSRSCFSNLGDVGAPGGDGDSSSCDPNVISDTTQCNPSFCPYGIISLVITDPTPGSEQYGYAYWLGTSFATPLVSGIAALRHENLAAWGLRGDWHAFLMQWLLEAAACNSSNGRLLTLQAGVNGVVGGCPP